MVRIWDGNIKNDHFQILREGHRVTPVVFFLFGELLYNRAMSLYAIGDLHLHFESELKAPAQLTEKIWKDHEKVFLENCRKTVTEKDTLVLVGDHSWGRNLRECAKDLQYICDLPGRKILLRGNHDMFWNPKKTETLNELFSGKLEFLQNNFFSYEDVALVGTKGYTFEGPFYLDRYGHIAGWDEEEAAHAEKLVGREAERLRISMEAAKAAGFRKMILFLHYPPTNILQKSSIFTKMAREYGVSQVVYGHCHGERHFHDSLRGEYEGILYHLVSGDCVKWVPQKIL